MGFVKMSELFSPELIKALAGNAYTAKDEVSPKDEMAAAWRDYLKEDKKHDKWDDKKDDKWCDKWDDKKDDKKCDKWDDKKDDKWCDKWDDKKDDKKHDKKDDKKDNECCCPEKIKFIFLLNNAVVINVNAACEEDD